MTAVELLKQRLIKDQQNFPIYNEYINGVIDYLDNQLLEMEKEQQGYSLDDLKEAYKYGKIYDMTSFEQFKNK